MEFAKRQYYGSLAPRQLNLFPFDPDWGGDGEIGCVPPRGFSDACHSCSIVGRPIVCSTNGSQFFIRKILKFAINLFIVRNIVSYSKKLLFAKSAVVFVNERRLCGDFCGFFVFDYLVLVLARVRARLVSVGSDIQLAQVFRRMNILWTHTH